MQERLSDSWKLCLNLSLRKKCSYSEFFWSVFSRFRIEYGESRSKSPYLVQMRENTDQKNFEFWHFSRNLWSRSSLGPTPSRVKPLGLWDLSLKIGFSFLNEKTFFKKKYNTTRISGIRISFIRLYCWWKGKSISEKNMLNVKWSNFMTLPCSIEPWKHKKQFIKITWWA